MPPVDADHPERSWGAASEADLVIGQILAIDAWFRACPEASVPATKSSREDRMERDRQRRTLEAISSAIRSRTALGQEDDNAPKSKPGSLRAVVAHRNPWFVQTLSAVLAEYGVHMVDQLVNGAEAIGVTIAEQPDLLVIEDAMALLTGVQAVQLAGRYAPRTLTAVQVGHRERIQRLLEAGADVAFVRSVPLRDVAGDLTALVEAHRQGDSIRLIQPVSPEEDAKTASP